jgi:2-aminoethylphosphonate dioxygenase
MGNSRGELDSTALASYASQGWALVPGFFSAEEAEQLVRFTEQVCELPEIAGTQMIYREPSLLDSNSRIIQRIENFCPYHLGFDKVIRGGQLQATVEKLFGAPAVLFKDKINFKMSGGAGFEAHQDQQAGWSTYAPLFVTAMAGLELLPVPTRRGDVVFFDSYVPHASRPNLTREQRRVLYVTYNRASDGDHRVSYYADKRASFPPDIERLPGVEYRFRV